MLDRFASDEGRRAYAKRKVTTEPVFGNIKANLRCRRVSRRGLVAVRSERRPTGSVHNLLKLRRSVGLRIGGQGLTTGPTPTSRCLERVRPGAARHGSCATASDLPR